jgi:general secretion pathway protein H
LVFDFEQHRMALEESAQSRMLRDREERNTGGGADPATEAERAALAEAERLLEGPKAPRAAFTPVKEFGFDVDDDGKGRSLGKGIRFRQVQTEHDEEPRTEGQAYLYFWPGGLTERAVIQLYRGDDDEGLTIEVSPLTGRAKVHRGRVELPEPRADGELSEREDT